MGSSRYQRDTPKCHIYVNNNNNNNIDDDINGKK